MAWEPGTHVPWHFLESAEMSRGCWFSCAKIPKTPRVCLSIKFEMWLIHHQLYEFIPYNTTQKDDSKKVFFLMPTTFISTLYLHYTLGYPPFPGCQSPPGRHSIFSRESLPKPSFATVTGKGDNPNFYGFCTFNAGHQGLGTAVEMLGLGELSNGGYSRRPSQRNYSATERTRNFGPDGVTGVTLQGTNMSISYLIIISIHISFSQALSNFSFSAGGIC